MPTVEQIRAMLSRASASGARSTILQPLVLLTGILTSGFVLSLSTQGPQWALILLGTLLGVCVAVYLVSYGYHAVKDPDALRSEKFTLSKIAIEKNLIGDDKFGLVEIMEFDVSGPQLSLPTKEAEGK